MSEIVKFEVQLRAVEAELENDPDNEELLAHKRDLLEYIELEKEVPSSEPTTTTCQESGNHSKSTSETKEVAKQKNLKERLKKKKLKRQQAVKQQEEIAESMMQSWKSFNRKILSKKGVVRKIRPPKTTI